jgi:predicted RNA-binding Zn ribbon-like protein
MVWDLGCWMVGTVGVFRGAIWGHRRLPAGEKALHGSRRCQTNAGVRRVLRRTGRRALGTFVAVVVALRGVIDHLVRAQSGVGYAIGAEKRRLDDHHLVRAATRHMRVLKGRPERRTRAPARLG